MSNDRYVWVLLFLLLPHLFEGPFGGEQVVDHVGRHANERGDTNAVAQYSGPEREQIVKQPHLRREGQETSNDEL